MPSVVAGGTTGAGVSGGNAVHQYMEILGAKAARDLHLDLKAKKQ